MPNRLARESSPYLRQHADNPVDWYPWGEEAFARARSEDKPILLSIGYSACHWCHVMAHESFEDPATARLMNQHFVNIKVDREERPDLDAIYMDAVQAMTGHGGWPMTVFLTPDGRPFFGGTYFPPTDRPGLPAFSKVLAGVALAYRSQREQILQGAEQLAAHLRQGQTGPTPTGELSPELLDRAAQAVLARVDPANGGFGGAPKFPPAMALEFLLRTCSRTGDRRALGAVELTLTAMARGGIYDQLGGGFHRYSVDERWLVPHFEKMLYDNALLARVYLLAYQATGSALYRHVAEETLDYVRREMTSPEGGFYSSQDADSDGKEGRYYVWTPDELAAVLGPVEGKLVGSYFGVTRKGNFEGRNVLHVPWDVAAFAQKAGVSTAELALRLGAARQRLLAYRERRTRPGRDEKVLADWNGLALRAFAEAASALGRPDYLAAAEANAAFLLDRMRRDGRLLHSYRDGQARVPGYLEDYADVAEGLLALYQAAFDPRWLGEARGLADQMLDLFWSEGEGAFYTTAGDASGGTPLILRPRSLADSATPSGAAVAVDLLLRLAALTGNARYTDVASRVLASAVEAMGRYPGAFGQLLCDLDLYLAGSVEVALVGEPDAPDTRALLAVVRSGYRPRQVVALKAPGEPAPAGVALLADRGTRAGRATAYVCRASVCQMPVTRPEDLARELAA